MGDDRRSMVYLRTSPVRAMAVPDIVLRIVELIAADSSDVIQYEDLFDDPTCRTLYRLATVSRVFSEPVLDLLWRRTTPWRLAILMPPHMFRIDASTRNALSLQSRPVVERCYYLRFASDGARLEATTTLASERFFFYSRRVKHLSRCDAHQRYKSRYQLSRRTVDHAVVLAWQQASAVLFPELYHLHIQMPSHEDRSLLHFMSPSITSLFVETPTSRERLDSLELPQDLAQRSKELVHFTSKLHEPDVSQAVVTAALSRASKLETVVVAGILTPDVLIHVASNKRLRKFCAQGNLDDHRHELTQGCFQNVEIAALCDYGPRLEFAHWFLKSASPNKVRDLTISLSPPTTPFSPARIAAVQCIGIAQLMARFTALVRVSFTCQSILKTDRSIQTARRMLESLSPLHQLEEIRIRTNCIMALSDADCLALFACWPHLRVCDVKALVDIVQIQRRRRSTSIEGLRLSLSALLEALMMCPHITEFSVRIACFTLPSEDSITQLQQLDHSFTGAMGGLDCDIADDASSASVMMVLERALPHLNTQDVRFQICEPNM